MRLLLAITLLASGLLSAQSTVKHGQGRWAGIIDFVPEKELGIKIPELMNTYYRKANGIPIGESLKKHSLWIDDFSGLGGDTYITDLGLHTSFGIYEIAPYSEGEIDIFIPMSELKKLSEK
ncbi:MAG: RsiV family protein [Bacteroidia bacterium]